MSDRKIKYPIRSSEVTDEEGRRGDEYREKPGTRHTENTKYNGKTDRNKCNNIKDIYG